MSKKATYYNPEYRVELPETDAKNGRNFAGKKEMIAAWSLVDMERGESVVVRWFMGRSNSASVIYCSIWFQTGSCTGGHGKAGGGGYCKMSAAFDAALDSAGVKLFDKETGTRVDVSGQGESRVTAALFDIGRALGGERQLIVNHGW